jgi:multidrug resistance efflux pump
LALETLNSVTNSIATGCVRVGQDLRPYEAVVQQKKAALAEAEQAVKQLRATFEQASAELERVKAQFELAQQNYDRQEELFAKKVVAQATLDTASRNLEARAS